MRNFKEILRSFFKKNTAEKQAGKKTLDDEAQPRKGEIKCLLSLPQNVVHPADLMKSLCMAIAMYSKEPVAASLQDIRLYSMYDLEDNSFLGSFYVLEHGGMFFGNIVGNPQIFACQPDAFRFEETEELFVPLKNDGKNMFVLMCLYERRLAKLTIKCLKKYDTAMRQGEILERFSGMPFDKAYLLCKQLLKF